MNKSLKSRLAKLEQSNKQLAEQVDYLERQVVHHDNMITLFTERLDVQYDLWKLTDDKVKMLHTFSES
jgi:hypothetical protein